MPSDTDLKTLGTKLENTRHNTARRRLVRSFVLLTPLPLIVSAIDGVHLPSQTDLKTLGTKLTAVDNATEKTTPASFS